VRFAFYGRVSTEDWQDPVTSQARRSSGSSPLTLKVPPVKALQDRAGNHGRLCRQPAAEEIMSQHMARRDAHAKPEDADVTEPRTCQAEHEQVVRLRRPVTEPAGDDGVSPDGGVSPDEPDADEFGLIGGIGDLGAADLGPVAPDARDPDADSGRPRK
jgi:hypothetical protein